MLNNFWIIQGVGVLGLLFSIIAFQNKIRKNILRFQSVSGIFFIIHFFLLSALAGAAMSVIVVIRNFVFEKKETNSWARSPIWFILFVVAGGVSVLLLKQGLISILPAIGVFFGTLAMWQNKPKYIRIYMLLSGLSWVPYLIVVRSYPGLIAQLIGGISLLIGMYRLDRKS